MSNQSGLQLALETFLASKDFRTAVITCTRAARQKTSYVVELMPAGTYRVLWVGQVGNKNDSPGHLFLELPVLDATDLFLWRGSDESFFNHHFEANQTELTSQMWERFKKF